MSADEILLDIEERMEKAIAVLKHALAGIRTGRANPGLVDSLRVEVYGSPTPIKQLASVGAAGSPRKSSSARSIPARSRTSKRRSRPAAWASTRMNDGRVIRLNVPPLSTEVRRKLVGRIKELTEEAKVAIRNVRRDGNKAADQEQKDKMLTEDECDQAKEEIQELTKKFENRATDLATAKEKEVMEN